MPDDESKDELMDTLSKGNFTMRILYEQLANVQKMGSVGQIMSMIPGLSNSGIFDKVLHLSRLERAPSSCQLRSIVILFEYKLHAMDGRAKEERPHRCCKRLDIASVGLHGRQRLQTAMILPSASLALRHISHAGQGEGECSSDQELHDDDGQHDQ